VADDCPVRQKNNFKFTFAVHPPPPSPTEEENSKERDGELWYRKNKTKLRYLSWLFQIM
jgi:hypothetical protein